MREKGTDIRDEIFKTYLRIYALKQEREHQHNAVIKCSIS